MFGNQRQVPSLQTRMLGTQRSFKNMALLSSSAITARKNACVGAKLTSSDAILLSGRGKLETRRQTAAAISKLEEATMTILLIPPGLSEDSEAIMQKREAEVLCAELAKLQKWSLDLE